MLPQAHLFLFSGIHSIYIKTHDAASIAHEIPKSGEVVACIQFSNGLMTGDALVLSMFSYEMDSVGVSVEEDGV